MYTPSWRRVWGTHREAGDPRATSALKAGLSSRWLPAYPSRNLTIHQTQLPTPQHGHMTSKRASSKCGFIPRKTCLEDQAKSLLVPSSPCPYRQTNPPALPPTQETINNLWGRLEILKKVNMLQIYSQNSSSSQVFGFVLFFHFSFLCPGFGLEKTHYYSKLLPWLLIKVKGEKTPETRLGHMRICWGHSLPVNRHSVPVDKKEGGGTKMLTHLENWNLHELIPKPSSQHKYFAHTHTNMSHFYPEHTCTHTLGLQILVKSTKAAAIGQFEELLLWKKLKIL